MKRTFLTLLCFTALAAVSATVAGRVARPSMSGLLVVAVIVATAAGGAGAFRRRSWPLALFLLLPGAYLLARFQIGLPRGTTGAGMHIAFYASRVADGATLYARATFPLDSGLADLRLLLSLAVYLVAGIAAFLALSLGRPLAGVVLLLCLAGFGFTVDGTARDPWSALAIVVLAAGLLALAHPRQRERIRLADAMAGAGVATVAVVLALSVLGTTTMAAGKPLRDWRTWDLMGPGNELMRFDWMLNYPRLITRGGDTKVMEVRSPVASYWRANVLADFTGTVWRSHPGGEELWSHLVDGNWTSTVPRALDSGVQGQTVTERFAISNTYTDRLFVGGWASVVRSALQLNLSADGTGTVGVTPPRGPVTQYEVTAFLPDSTATDLIGRGTTYPSSIASAYLQLPFPARGTEQSPGAEAAWTRRLAGSPNGAEWAGLYRLNESVVGSEREPYRMALAIEGYLRSDRFRYTLRPPASDYSSPYAAFLFDTHAGYCQHFAGAMALLLRFNGIPARVVVGFTQGTRERNGAFLVRRKDAHAWVEAYFPGVGWAQFEPTPGRSLPPGFAGESAAFAPGEAAASTVGQGDRPTLDLPGRARIKDPGGLGQGAVVAAPPERLPWLFAPLVILAGWPVCRALLRRRSRLGSSTDERLRASVRSLYATLGDHGVRVPASQTLDETALMLDLRYGLDPGDVPDRVQAVLFGGRDATEDDVHEVQGLRRRLAAGLRAGEGPLQRLAAAYGLRRPRLVSLAESSPDGRRRRQGGRDPHDTSA